MGQPVVHFEVIGRDGAKLRAYYGELFDWQINADNPMSYGLVEAAEGSVGPGIAGGIGQGPETIMEDITLGQFKDPEGNVIGVTQSAA